MPAHHRSPWLPGALAGLVLSLDPVSRQRSAATALELCHITATDMPNPATRSLEPAVQMVECSACRRGGLQRLKKCGAASRPCAAQMAPRASPQPSLMPWSKGVHSRRENGREHQQMLLQVLCGASHCRDQRKLW